MTIEKERKRDGYKKPPFALGQLVQTGDGARWWVTSIDYKEERAELAEQHGDPFGKDKQIGWSELTAVVPTMHMLADAGTIDIVHFAALVPRVVAESVKAELAAAGIPEAR